MTGHFNKCGKIWTLDTERGLCQWCGQQANCQDQRTQARIIKSRGKKRQAAAKGDYDQLQGDWLLYYKVTSYLTRHIRFDDRLDWLHDTMIEMAKVKAKYELIPKPLTEAGLMRVASYQVTEYWERLRQFTTGLDCGNCSKEQRRRCREDDLYSECPKYHQLVSLDRDKAGLLEFLADDDTVDLDLKLDARRKLQGLPKRLVQIGYKRYAGIPLTKTEQRYLNRYQQKTWGKQQLALISVSF